MSLLQESPNTLIPTIHLNVKTPLKRKKKKTIHLWPALPAGGNSFPSNHPLVLYFMWVIIITIICSLLNYLLRMAIHQFQSIHQSSQTAMGLTLYYIDGSPPVRSTLLCIRALGLHDKVNYQFVNLFKKENLQPEFLKVRFILNQTFW